MQIQFSKLAAYQKILIIGIVLSFFSGLGVYFFYVGNKAKIVKIKYYGEDGFAVISKKEIKKIGADFKNWRKKYQLYIGFSKKLNSLKDSTKNKLKIDLPNFDEQLEYIQTVVEVSKSMWKQFQEGDTVKIKYLASDPKNYILVLN